MQVTELADERKPLTESIPITFPSSSKRGKWRMSLDSIFSIHSSTESCGEAVIKLDDFVEISFTNVSFDTRPRRAILEM